MDGFYTPKSPFDPRPRCVNDRSRKKRLHLFRKSKGKCYYCRCKTIMPESNIEHSGTPPLNMATTEHIFSKWDIRRALSNKVVLCCFKCNRDKNNEDMLKAWDGYDSYRLVSGISIFDLIEYIK